VQSSIVPSTAATSARPFTGPIGVAAALLLLVPSAARAADPAPSASATPTAAPSSPSDEAAARSSALMPTPKLRAGNFTRLTWDANLEGAIGGMFLGPTKIVGFTRARLGALYVDEQDARSPKFYALGLTYEASNFLRATSAVGVQAEFMLVKSLFWAQAGAVVDFQPRPGFNLTAGWSIFGLEGQMRWDHERAQGELVWGVFGKLRLPISWFFVGRSR
jgi:hypothetical protein